MKKGCRVSFAWHSILAAQTLLVEGMQWRIGNGKAVSIWGDKWIPKPVSFAIQSPCTQLPIEAKVEMLIDKQVKEWNFPIIQSIFHEDEAAIICSLPFSKYGPPDRLIWRVTTTGCFIVQSTYHLEREIQSREKGEGSVQPGNCGVLRFRMRRRFLLGGRVKTYYPPEIT